MDFWLIPLAPGSLNHVANIVKGYALALGVAFAIWFVWQWWRARQRETIEERALRAKAVHARHLGLALQHPELAQPMLGSLSSAIEVARYRTFVAGLLAAADEILSLDPAAGWRDTLVRHFGPHRSYLASAEFRDSTFRDCSVELRQLLRPQFATQGAQHHRCAD